MENFEITSGPLPGSEKSHVDRKSVVEGKSVDLGGRRTIKKTGIVIHGMTTARQ